MLLSLALWLLTATHTERLTLSTVSCRSVADCWLDAQGRPIARPRGKRGLKLPRGDCGRNLIWLRNRLLCTEQEHVCASQFMGDAC